MNVENSLSKKIMGRGGVTTLGVDFLGTRSKKLKVDQ